MENLSANKRALIYSIVGENTSQICIFHAPPTEFWTVCLSEQEVHD